MQEEVNCHARETAVDPHVAVLAVEMHHRANRSICSILSKWRFLRGSQIEKGPFRMCRPTICSLKFGLKEISNWSSVQGLRCMDEHRGVQEEVRHDARGAAVDPHVAVHPARFPGKRDW